MRPIKLVLPLLVALVPVCLGAAPAPAPATASATAPATSPGDGPKAGFVAFMQGMLDGDEKATFDRLYLSTDDARQEAQAVIGVEIYTAQLNKALQAEFQAGAGPAEDAAALEAIKSQIAAASVTVTGDNAELSMGAKSVVSLVRENGVWKVDFSKALRAADGPYDKEKVAAEAARAGTIKGLVADVKAHKFKTREEADAEMQKRLGDVPMSVGAGVAASRRNAAMADIAGLRMALEVFEVDNGRYPTTAEGLDGLVHAPKGMEANWHQYIVKVPVDPWGHVYIYRLNVTGDFEVFSAGPDGKEGNADDITKDSKQ